MSLFPLSFSNFKRSLKNYVSLIASLSFTIFILFNFQNIVFSDALDQLRYMQKSYINIVVQSVSVVLIFFMFFFVWYATNVFLNQRKKEIGIYTFMGLDNSKIGRMYLLESLFTGLFALMIGLFTGIIFSKLFMMILLAISDIRANISFQISLNPILITAAVFLAIYLLMMLKGYLNIVRSSVLDMLSASRKNELRKECGWVTAFKVVIGLVILLSGYFVALRTGSLSSMGYALLATVLVIIGVYLLYDGFIPFILQKLTANKAFLYQKQRNLWVNNLAFRMKKNYRTYAIVTILLTSSVTVLATSLAMKNRYDGVANFRETYTYQVMSFSKMDQAELTRRVEKDNKIKYQSSMMISVLKSNRVDTQFSESGYSIISYSQIKAAAKAANQTFDYPKLEENEVIELDHQYIMSFASDFTGTQKMKMDGQTYEITAVSKTPYLGSLQENMETYIVSDETYQRLKPTMQTLYLENIRIKNPQNFAASKDDLDPLMTAELDPENSQSIQYVAVDPSNPDISWIRIMYSITVFLFLVFLFASVSVIFMKLYNDAFDDKERYTILKKIGIPKKTLRQSIAKEIRFAYFCPFVLMVISSYFSVHALANVMKTNLIQINIYSTLAIGIICFIFYHISVNSFIKNIA